MKSRIGQNNVPISFPGPLGSKRRRMRSGGNVSVLPLNPSPFDTHDHDASNILHSLEMDDADESGADSNKDQGGKCKGSTTIPIFLKKTYKMIDTCAQNIASWTEDGDMFVIKDPDTFANEVIPQYFEHNKFTSFARQLNFYGFRKVQTKPVRNSDFDAHTAKFVTFFNGNFKRGRCDLLKNIHRSTRGGNNPLDQQREVQILRDQISTLEQKVEDMCSGMEERMRGLELDMLARMEQMMLAMRQQQPQLHLQSMPSVGTLSNNRFQSVASVQVQSVNTVPPQHHWDSNAYSLTSSQTNLQSIGTPPMINSFQVPEARQSSMTSPSNAPTLPPHPKQKHLPINGIPSIALPVGHDRLNSLRGISTLSRGLSGLARGTSIESNSSAGLMRSTWEDKFFSMLMLGDAEQSTTTATTTANSSHLGPTPIALGATPSNGMNAHMAGMPNPVAASNGSMGMRSNGSGNVDTGELSDISESGIR